MSFNESYISVFKNEGLAKSRNHGDYDALMMFSPSREEEFKKMLSLVPHDVRPEIDSLFRIFVKEEIDLAHENKVIATAQGSSSIQVRALELMITNIDSEFLTGDLIKSKGGMPVTITLVDSHTNEVVKSGPEASGSVEIVAVDGVEGNEFKSIFVHKTEGNKSERVGILYLNLIKGTAVLPVVSLARNGRWMKISNIRLQAKFVDDFKGIQVKDAQTEPFILKDRRNGAYKKHLIPSLRDDVWRLNKVGKKGNLVKILIKENIKKVEDFINHLFLHPQRLEEIFAGANHAKSLKITVKHARKCLAKFKYQCINLDQKTEVVFNVSAEVVGLYLNNQFLSSDTLSKTQKEVSKNLVISAFENWGDVVIVDEDHFVHSSPQLLNNSVFLNGLDLDISEGSLFGNVHHDEQHLNPELLPEPLRTRQNEIFREYESLCTTNILEPEPIYGLVVREAAHKNRFCKRWRMVFYLLAFRIGSVSKRSLGDSRAHKKQRLS